LHRITVTAVGSWSCLGGPTQKNHAFKQRLNHKDFKISFQDLLIFKLSLGQLCPTKLLTEPKFMSLS